MKRAKIMLTSIAVLAVVGGTLAFKAQKFGHGNIYCKFSDPVCRVVEYTTQFNGIFCTTDNPCATAQVITATYTTTNCNEQNAQSTFTVWCAQ